MIADSHDHGDGPTTPGTTKGTADRLHFPAAAVRFLRLEVTGTTKGVEGKPEPPLLEELEATGRDPARPNAR